MTTTNPTPTPTAEPAEPTPVPVQRSIWDELDTPEPEPAPIGWCCRRPLIDRRWGMWICPGCGRAYQYPYNPKDPS